MAHSECKQDAQLFSHWCTTYFCIYPLGPFLHLDAEKISDELDIMWRTMHKLTKSLSNLPGPCCVAKSFKSKIDQFKQHLPILTTICNPGIKDRHWEKVSWIHFIFLFCFMRSADRHIDIKCPVSSVIHAADVNNLCFFRLAALWAWMSNRMWTVHCWIWWSSGSQSTLTSKTLHRVGVNVKSQMNVLCWEEK